MERIAHPPAPLGCYGTGQFATNNMCKTCPQAKPCAKLMGSRIGKITLAQVRVNLIPTGFDVDISQTDDNAAQAKSIESIYQDCYCSVFGKPSKMSVGHHAAAIVAAADALDLSLDTYIRTLMVAHKENDEKDMIAFYPTRLLVANAGKTIELYQEICQRKYGSFGGQNSARELELLTDVPVEKNSPYRKMIDSEGLAGEYFLGFKRKRDGFPDDLLFSQRELALDPLWLATEHRYKTEILTRYIQEPFGTPVQQKHRHAVLQWVQQMKRNKHFAISVFSARGKALLHVLPTVVARSGLQLTDLEMSDVEVTDSLELWYHIGLCLQQLECLKFTWGLPNVFAVNTF